MVGFFERQRDKNIPSELWVPVHSRLDGAEVESLAKRAECGSREVLIPNPASASPRRSSSVLVSGVSPTREALHDLLTPTVDGLARMWWATCTTASGVATMGSIEHMRSVSQRQGLARCRPSSCARNRAIRVAARSARKGARRRDELGVAAGARRRDGSLPATTVRIKAALSSAPPATAA